MSKFTSEQNRAFWEEYALKYKDNPFGAHSDKHIVDLENEFIISQLKEKQTDYLLDIGCGNGQRTLLFSQYAKKTLGTDYSKNMINEANILLSGQEKSLQNKVSFKVSDVMDLENDVYFDSIISCRCFINQTSYENQIKLFHLLHSKLNEGGSLIIAELSLEGIDRLNTIRQKFGLGPIKVAWHNLPIKEEYVFPQIEELFEIKKLNRLGIFYYISRVIHPAIVFPKEPEPNSKINEVGMRSEILQRDFESKLDNSFEKFGGQLLIHFRKK